MSNLKCDLHIHSNYSDGQFTIEQIVDLYGKNKYSVISITDHLCETDNLIGGASHRLGYSLNKNIFSEYMQHIKLEASRALKKYNMLLLPGYEISKNSFINNRSAHLLIIGIEKFICPNMSVESILELAKKFGALTIAAHPFYTGDFEFQSYYLWSRRKQLQGLVDAWEFNYRSKTIGEVLNSGMALIANSDLHHAKHFTSWRSCYQGEISFQALAQAVRKKQLNFYTDTLTFTHNKEISINV